MCPKDDHFIHSFSISPPLFSIRLSLHILDFIGVLVETCMSVIIHISFKNPGRVWISCPKILSLLHNPLYSPWYSYFSTILTGYLDPG